MVSDIDNIKAICQEALDNTDIKSETLCEDTHDYYLLGKVDLANEILNELNKKPKDTPQKEWIRGHKKWKKQQAENLHAQNSERFVNYEKKSD